MMPNEVLKNDGGYIKTEELEWWRLKSHNDFEDLYSYESQGKMQPNAKIKL